jgi:hypothetical protein
LLVAHQEGEVLIGRGEGSLPSPIRGEARVALHPEVPLVVVVQRVALAELLILRDLREELSEIVHALHPLCNITSFYLTPSVNQQGAKFAPLG